MEYNSAIKNVVFMKFLVKWMELGAIILSEVIQSQKNIHSMYSLISGYQPKKLRIPKKQFIDLMKLKKKKGQKVDASVLLRRENKMLIGGNKGTNRGAGIGEKIIQRLPNLEIYPICSH